MHDARARATRSGTSTDARIEQLREPSSTSASSADRDAAIYVESDHMPEWAENDAREYWHAADLYERANGRLYVSADFALPRDLDAEDQAAIAPPRERSD